MSADDVKRHVTVQQNTMNKSVCSSFAPGIYYSLIRAWPYKSSAWKQTSCWVGRYYSKTGEIFLIFDRSQGAIEAYAMKVSEVLEGVLNSTRDGKQREAWAGREKARTFETKEGLPTVVVDGCNSWASVNKCNKNRKQYDNTVLT